MGRIGVGGCGETTGRNSNKKYENQREGIKFKRKITKTRNETLFRSFAKQLETLFFLLSYFLQVRETGTTYPKN